MLERKIQYIKWCLLLLSFLFLLIDDQLGKGIMILLCNLCCLLECRKNDNLLIVYSLLLYFNYSIIGANFIFDIESSFLENQYMKSSVISMNVLLIFNSLMLFSTPKIIKRTHYYNIKKRWHPFVIFFICIILAIIVATQFEMPSIDGERGDPSPLYEYSLSIAMLGILFCGNSVIKYPLIFVCFIYIFLEVVFGGRVIALQYLLIIYLVIFSKKWTIKRIMPYAFILFILFTIVGVMRGNLLSGNFDLSSIISDTFKSGMTLDTAYSAYFTSEQFVKVSLERSFADRLDFFKDFILSIFLGQGGELSKTNLPIYTHQFYWHCYGGMIPHYFYYYLGYWGIIIPYYVLKIYINFINNINSKHIVPLVIGFFIVISTPRWYLYTPLGLFRGVLFTLFCYFSFNTFNQFINYFIKTCVPRKSKQNIISRTNNLRTTRINTQE